MRSLYTNHGLVLMRIAVNPDVTLSQLALDIGIRERAAYLIVRDLAKEGFIEKQKVGRRNYYRVNVDRVLDYEPLPGLTVRQQISAMAGALAFPTTEDTGQPEGPAAAVPETATPGS